MTGAARRTSSTRPQSLSRKSVTPKRNASAGASASQSPPLCVCPRVPTSFQDHLFPLRLPHRIHHHRRPLCRRPDPPPLFLVQAESERPPTLRPRPSRGLALLGRCPGRHLLVSCPSGRPRTRRHPRCARRRVGTCQRIRQDAARAVLGHQRKYQGACIDGIACVLI
jgi:hypothetical protein